MYILGGRSGATDFGRMPLQTVQPPTAKGDRKVQERLLPVPERLPAEVPRELPQSAQPHQTRSIGQRPAGRESSKDRLLPESLADRAGGQPYQDFRGGQSALETARVEGSRFHTVSHF